MESCATVILAGLILVLLWMFNIKHKRNWHLPPGPTALPLIGNLLQIDNKAPFKSFVKVRVHFLKYLCGFLSCTIYFLVI